MKGVGKLITIIIIIIIILIPVTHTSNQCCFYENYEWNVSIRAVHRMQYAKRTDPKMYIYIYIFIKNWIIGKCNSRVLIDQAIMGYEPLYHDLQTWQAYA